MHLQENILFDLDLGVKVTRNVAQYPLHHVTYPGTKSEYDHKIPQSCTADQPTAPQHINSNKTSERQ